MSIAKPDKTLDARGTLCPIPVIRANEAISEINVNDILEVLATDPASKSDFAAWSRIRGHEILFVTEEGNSPTVYRFLIRRGSK